MARHNTSTTWGRAISAMVLTASLGACGGSESGTDHPSDPYANGASYPWSDRGETISGDPYVGGRQFPWTGVNSALPDGVTSSALTTGDNDLPDVQYTSATNGWGPLEKNLSNGEQGAGDGRTLSIGGVTFAKGLGMHARGGVHYTLTGSCSLFTAQVGIDDEVGNRGSVKFQVFGDGILRAESAVLTGAMGAQALSADIRGVSDLYLVVTDGGDSISYDHADWAIPRVKCQVDAAPGGAPYISDLPTTSASNGWGPLEKDLSNGEQRAGDGRTLSIGGVTYAKGLGMHAPAQASYYLGGRCTTLTAQIGVDDEVGARGSVTFQVFGDGVKRHESAVITGAQGAQSLSVDVSGVSDLRLAVTAGGDNISYDHADWGMAKLTCTGDPLPPTASTVYAYSSIASQPNAVSEAQGESVGGKLYVFGGFDSKKSCCTPTDRAQVFDPATNAWTALPVVPERGMTHAGMTTDGSAIYFAGGYVANSTWTGQVFGTRAAWKFTVATQTYTRLPDLPVQTAAGQLEYLNGRLHYFGGTNPARTQDLGDHYVLDLAAGAATWTTAAPLPQPRHHMASAVLGGRIYAIGGQVGHDAALATLAAVHMYDPATGAWTAVTPLPRARSHIGNSSFVLGSRIVVAGGETSHNVPMTDVSAFDPATNTWTALSPLPVARASGVAGAGGTGFVFSGGTSSASGWQATPGN